MDASEKVASIFFAVLPAVRRWEDVGGWRRLPGRAVGSWCPGVEMWVRIRSADLLDVSCGWYLF